MTPTTHLFWRPAQNPWDDEVEHEILQLFPETELFERFRHLTSPWLSRREADQWIGELGTTNLEHELLSRLVRIAAVYAAMENTGSPAKWWTYDAIAEQAAQLLDIGYALETPDTLGLRYAPLPSLKWRPGWDDRLALRLGKEWAPIYKESTETAIRLVVDWCQQKRKGMWKESEGWTPGGAWIFPEQA
jgi:hypothetical protein